MQKNQRKITFNVLNFSYFSQFCVSSVRRLTDTWDLLGDDGKDLFAALKDFLETRRNWERYRSRLASCTPPCVPYLGAWLKCHHDA